MKRDDVTECLRRPKPFDLGDWHWMDSDRTWPWATATDVGGRLTIVSEHQPQFVADDGQQLVFTGGKGRVFSLMPCEVAG